jgi:DNA-binding beta-propeller fold protein YncE
VEPDPIMRTVLNLAAATALAATLTAAAPPTYRVTGSIKAADGGWDYAAVEPENQLLYVARGSEVTEIDLAHGNTVRAFGQIAKGHAVVPLPGHMLLVSSGHDDSVRLFDTVSGKEEARIATGTDPDAALYDAASGHAAVMNAKAGTISVIDVAKRAVVRTITLKPGLEFAQLAKDGTLFVNNEDENEIETANLRTGKAGPAIRLAGCTGPTGLALDPASHMLISACANGKAAVVNAVTRKQTGSLAIGAGPDAVILDAARRLAFIPCGRDGTLSMIALGGAKGPVVKATIKTAVGARTGALDPRTGRLYLPTAAFGPAPAGGGRPAMLPGSFEVLVVSPD